MDGDQSRTPKSLQGLLKFCMESTQTEDASSSSEFQAMTDEDKMFIKQAIEAAMGSDPVKQMMEDLQVLTKSDTESEDIMERKEAALEDLQMHCENMDLANDFQKIGGYNIFPSILSHPESGLRWRAAELVATLVQNNPYCQKAALEAGLMPLLLNRLDQDEVDMVRIKALYAISCLSRDFQPSQEVLLEGDGLSVLFRAIQTNSEKLQTKTAFLLAYLCATVPKIKEAVSNMGLVEQLAALLQQDHKDYHEHLVRALLNLTEDNAMAVQECQRSELNLHKFLTDRIEYLKGKEQYMEELECCKQLLAKCFPGGTAAER